jgi:hypothetical protein
VLLFSSPWTSTGWTRKEASRITASRDESSIARFLTERSELANELRQSTPFAGALKPQERWKIWRETRERFVSP